MSTEEGILVADRTFWYGNQLVRAGSTVRAGHPMTEKCGKMLRPMKVDFEYEEPSTSRHAKRAEPEPEKKEPPAKVAPRSANVKFANPPTRKK